jgi:endonuclease YncB( thermonuclease family)
VEEEILPPPALGDATGEMGPLWWWGSRLLHHVVLEGSDHVPRPQSFAIVCRMDRMDSDQSPNSHPTELLVMVPEAAEALGLTVEAVRARLNRGTLSKVENSDGTVLVKLDADHTPRYMDGEMDGEGRLAWLKYLVVLAVTISLLAGCSGSQSSATAMVTRVVEGDTVDISPAVQGMTRVRLIGVDAPETEDPICGNQPYGDEAFTYTKSRLENQRVGLEFDVQKTDHNDRLLAYVHTTDEEMFNETLLREGYAQLATFRPNVKYDERLQAAQEEAQAAGRGLWGLSAVELAAQTYRANGIGRADCTDEQTPVTDPLPPPPPPPTPPPPQPTPSPQPIPPQPVSPQPVPPQPLPPGDQEPVPPQLLPPGDQEPIPPQPLLPEDQQQ